MDECIYLSSIELKEAAASQVYIQENNRAKLFSDIHPAKPVALLFRQIATPNYELLWFLRKSRKLGFEPVVIEHVSDQFCVHNSFKRSLVSLPIVNGRSKNGKIIWNRLKILHHDRAESKPIKSIYLTNGESLVDFHHRILISAFGENCPALIDLSELIPSASLGAIHYYKDLFNLLLGNYVLFEDFVVDESTEDFFVRIVWPSFKAVVHSSGRSPKIARLIRGKRAASPLWNSYPLITTDRIKRGSHDA